MVHIEESTVAYKKEFSAMIMSSAEYFKTLFGRGIRGALEKMYVREKNLFSHHHCHVIKSDNEIAAMILCYDYDTKQKENLITGWLLFRFLGPALLRNLSVLLQMNRTIGQLTEGDFYISNIATFDKFKRKGFAKKLLSECENIALDKYMQRMKLDVEKENAPAISLYRSLGYSISEEFRIKSKKIDLKFIRMVKSME